MQVTRSAYLLLLLLIVGSLIIGCSRTRYRIAADRDSYAIVQEKTTRLTNASMSPNYNVRPDTRSRFYDPTNPDCPQLPVPRPVLRGYDLPPLASDMSLPTTTVTAVEGAVAIAPSIELVSGTVGPDDSVVQSLSHTPDQPVVTAAFDALQIQPPQPTVQTPELIPPPSDSPSSNSPSSDSMSKDNAANAANSNTNSSINKVTIPPKAWEVLPQNCIARMLEFQSLRDEHVLTYKDKELSTVAPADKRPLSLANLMELATINSREFQSSKELLFRSALALTRQRYQFELNPIPFGNGSAANYRSLRTGGIEQNSLSVPSSVGVQRTLNTGGQFLARFANSVVLTFNGPSGFASDFGSEMVFDFQQTIFQRDIRFEQLTQTERDVVYAMRDYLRFRKQLFRDISNQYYNLLVSYRGIEINAQDYFTNLRGFLQSQAEYRTAEKIPRIQVDQFEQNVLRTRSNLVNNCFALEAALDQLKFRLGLPTEMTIHIDLSELESIALKDELSVARQMINRARTELITTRGATTIDATTLANVAEVLADRMANILRIQARIEANGRATAQSTTTVDPNATAASVPAVSPALAQAAKELDDLQQLLKILGVRMQVDFLRAELTAQMKSPTPAPALRVLIRAVDLSEAELQIVDLALESPQLAKDSKTRSDLLIRREQVVAELNKLGAFIDELSARVGAQVDETSLALFEKLPERMKQSVELAEVIAKLSTDASQVILPAGGESMAMKVQTTVDKTIQLSDKLLDKGPDGWEEIVLDQDEALLTGLVQRLDLMNQRGDLADAWRQIKLAGDDLRSIMNLQATHFLRTDSKKDNPFDFTFDDSETRLSVALDTPLNRRLQRNNFRLALINYNVGIRNLIAAEDSIKLDIREDLRQLSLDRNQYVIAVASAALAYERVISTRLRLQFAVQNVAARDFLEAQQAYTNALSAIARQHVNYISDRTELFFDLEAFDVDSNGHWSGVDKDYGPQVNVDFPTTNPRPYDTLPPAVRYSPTIRQMESIPPGNAYIREATGN